MKAIKIGKAGQNHYQQGHNGKNDNANHRQGKQGNMEFFVKKGRKILPEAVDMLSFFRFFLQRAYPADIFYIQNQAGKKKQDTHHAEKQNLKGIIKSVHFVFQRFRIENGLPLHIPQGIEFAQVGKEKDGEKTDRRQLQQRGQNSLSVLPATEITHAAKQQGGFYPEITGGKLMKKRRKEAGN